jgi:hypothetical protein
MGCSARYGERARVVESTQEPEHPGGTRGSRTQATGEALVDIHRTSYCRASERDLNTTLSWRADAMRVALALTDRQADEFSNPLSLAVERISRHNG